MPVTYTYDLSTDIGRVREWLVDTDLDNALFSDEQIAYYLLVANDMNVYTGNADIEHILLAVAIALEINANRLAYLATKQKIAIFQEDTNVTYEAVLAQAEHFRNLAGMEGGIAISAPDNFYQIIKQTTNPFPTDPTIVAPVSSLEVW